MTLCGRCFDKAPWAVITKAPKKHGATKVQYIVGMPSVFYKYETLIDLHRGMAKSALRTFKYTRAVAVNQRRQIKGHVCAIKKTAIASS